MEKAKFILSKSKLLRQYKIVSELADEVSYSFKTNPKVGILLEKLTKCKFTVQSLKSLDFVKDKKRVWFLAQSLDSESLGKLFSLGVNSFIVDNNTDLEFILKHIAKKNVKINLMLRMRMKEYTVKTQRHYVYGLFSSEVNELISKLKPNKNISALGIHFHRKTENIGEWGMQEELAELLEKKTLGSIDMIDMGGGIPVEYKNYSVEALPHIFAKIKKFKKWANSYGIKTIAEPGRFLAAPCIELQCRITSMDKGTILVNCSVYNSSMDTIVANIKLPLKGELNSGERYLIKGCTPDSMDIFRYRVYLKNPNVGDTLTFLNAGAYTYSTNFCNLEELDTAIIN